MSNHFIKAIPAFQDNYIWAIHNPQNTDIIIVDPGDARPVLAYLQQQNLNLKAILITHHHWDHSGGISTLLEQFPTIPVYGPAQEKDPVLGVTHPMKEHDSISFPVFGLTFTVLDIPGHTKGHIAFFSGDILFCGDTLFSGGCGRVFEGTAEQMVSSLNKLKHLPGKTLVYCGHEYTLANIQFAKTIEPTNSALLAYEQKIRALIANNLPTVPSLMEDELQINPFLRCEKDSIVQAVLKKTQATHSDPTSIFVQLRTWKNKFSG